MPITRVNHFTAKPDSSELLAEFLSDVITVVSAAQGCLSCQLLRNQIHSQQFVILETWDSVDSHQKAAGMIPKERIMSVMAFLAEPPHGEYLSAVE